MKKRMLAIMMSVLMAAGICSGVTVYADADSKTLTVGFDAEYPPFGYMDENGEYVGFDLDVAQKVCDNLGWELVKKPINWDSKDMELNSGNIDCIWNGFTINGREDDYTWSDPYLNNEQVMVVASDSGIETLADLAGKNVVVQAASAALDALNSDDNKELTDSFGSIVHCPAGLCASGSYLKGFACQVCVFGFQVCGGRICCVYRYRCSHTYYGKST